MSISPETLSRAVKLFKSTRMISTSLLMRKFKLDCKAALQICELIEKRFPNLWREGRDEFNRKMKT
jgi:hypothetical protein